MKYRHYPNLSKRWQVRHLMYNAELDLIQEQEGGGIFFVIRPHSSLPVKRMEKDPAKLKTCYEMGRQAAETARERLLAFLKK